MFGQSFLHYVHQDVHKYFRRMERMTQDSLFEPPAKVARSTSGEGSQPARRLVLFLLSSFMHCSKKSKWYSPHINNASNGYDEQHISNKVKSAKPKFFQRVVQKQST